MEPSWLIYYNTTIAPQGLEISMLGIRAPARPHMKLRCVASIGTHRRERTVVLGNVLMIYYVLFMIKISFSVENAKLRFMIFLFLRYAM